MKVKYRAILLILFYAVISCFSADSGRYGSVRGFIRDGNTKQPLPGANVILVDTGIGTATDESGFFEIDHIPVGGYILQFDFIGYTPKREPDIIVKSERTMVADVELHMTILESDAVTVTAGYFDSPGINYVNGVEFEYEEIRRAPGSAGDVSRIIMGLPSIAKVDDQKNTLIVRGGSPMENGFYVDNIEIPNINHFPSQGMSGGAIGVVNVDLIRDVEFQTGGFPAMYGDRLSSIMELTLREGNRDEHDVQLDFNFAGIGGVAEGPLPNNIGSWLISMRRSYLDLLIDAIDVGTGVSPLYADYQGKVVCDLSRKHSLSGLLVASEDHNTPDRETAEENDMVVFGNQDIHEITGGVNWKALWNENGYSNTSVSFTSSRFDEDFYETGTGNQLIRNRSLEQSFKLRNVNHILAGRALRVDYGIEIRHSEEEYDNFYGEYTDALGDTIPELKMDTGISATRYSGFIQCSMSPLPRLALSAGIRADHYSRSENTYFSPRISLSYAIDNVTAIRGSSGLFVQSIPTILAAQNQSNRKLEDPRSYHYIFGIDHLLSESIRLSIDTYLKKYMNFPLDPAQPDLFLIDEMYYRYGFYLNHEELVDTGAARAYGVEAMIQKKLARDFYGLIGASYSRAQYGDSRNSWRDRVFDNRYIFSVEGGYKPDETWEFSARWIYAGGVPYTPFDIEQSTQLNRAVLDEDRINESRNPDYHSLNLRLDRRFHFSHSNLILYVSVWNAYNRKNIASHFWNQIENKPDIIHQWGILPIFGVEFEF